MNLSKSRLKQIIQEETKALLKEFKQLIKEQAAAKSHRVKGKQGYYQILRDMGLLKGLKKNEMRAQIQKLKKAFQGQVITTKDIVSVDAAGNFTVVGPRQPKKAAAPTGPPGRLIKPEAKPEAKPEVKVKPDPNAAYNKLKQRRDVQGAKPGEPGAKKTVEKIRKYVQMWMDAYKNRSKEGRRELIKAAKQFAKEGKEDWHRKFATQFLRVVDSAYGLGLDIETTKVDKPGVRATTRTKTETTSGTVSRASLPVDQQRAYAKLQMSLTKRAIALRQKRGRDPRVQWVKGQISRALDGALSKGWKPRRGFYGLKKCCPKIYKYLVSKTIGKKA